MKGFLLTLLIFWIISRFLKKNVYINTFNSYNQTPPSNTPPRRKEGEITIERIDKKSKKDRDDDGEFIDYEEVK